MRPLAVILLVASIASAEEAETRLVSIREPVRAFFGDRKNDPLPAALADLVVPPLHKLPFVRGWIGRTGQFGWRRGDKLVVGL